MRIAISGAHGTGKTSLLESLANSLPNHVVIEEPYYQLENEGHIFAGLPSLEDFESQFMRSIQSIQSSGENTLFDRCPADFIAYMLSLKNEAPIGVEPWISRAREAMAMLDQVIFVPIENPDRITIPNWENRALRQRVDESLQGLLLNDQFGLGIHAVEVAGSIKNRVEKVLQHIRFKK
jgi:predicted ATPase